jgi:hypothetical protein
MSRGSCSSFCSSACLPVTRILALTGAHLAKLRVKQQGRLSGPVQNKRCCGTGLQRRSVYPDSFAAFSLEGPDQLEV